MKKDNIWGQHSLPLFLNKGIKLQHTFHNWQETIVLGMFTGSLHAQNWQVWCVAINGHTRDIVQHICTKLHLILIVVLILRPIGPWKKIALIVPRAWKIGYMQPCINFWGSLLLILFIFEVLKLSPIHIWKPPLYTSGSHFIHSTARSKSSHLNHFPIYYRLLQK